MLRAHLSVFGLATLAALAACSSASSDSSTSGGSAGADSGATTAAGGASAASVPGNSNDGKGPKPGNGSGFGGDAGAGPAPAGTGGKGGGTTGSAGSPSTGKGGGTSAGKGGGSSGTGGSGGGSAGKGSGPSGGAGSAGTGFGAGGSGTAGSGWGTAGAGGSSTGSGAGGGNATGGGAGTGAAGATADPTVRAGEWDDNANYREYLKYLASSASLPNPKVDVSERQFVVVRDANGKAVDNCPINVVDTMGHVAHLTTYPSGRTPLFPHAEGLEGTTFTVIASCAEGQGIVTATAHGTDGVFVVDLTGTRAEPAVKDIDLVFVLDTTGSMGEEIDAIKATIAKVATSLTPATAGVKVRVALVAYKDYYDVPYTTKVFPFSYDLPAFQQSVAGLSAAGGGDIPEAVNEAMHATSTLPWRPEAFARFAFLMGADPTLQHNSARLLGRR